MAFKSKKKNIERLLDLATAVAVDRLGRKHSYQFGLAGIRSDGAMITAYNDFAENVSPEAHAEVRGTKKSDVGTILAVVRINERQEWMLSRPCRNCFKFMKQKGIYKVAYTISEGEYGVITFDR